MARPLRIEYPNAYYHVSNKGDDQGKVKIKIFPGSRFYTAFLEHLGEACRRFNVEVHAYCLLNNEYHLLIKTPEGNLSRFMRQVDGVYTQAYQTLKKEQGSIFRARYKSVLIQPEKYLLEVSRYIHSLPVLKKSKPSDYKWSSMGFYLNRDKGEPWQVRDEVLGQMPQAGRKFARYGDYVEEGVDEELQHFYGKKNLLSIMGDAKFSARARAKVSPGAKRGVFKGALAKQRPSIKRVVSAVALQFKVSEKSILKAARGPGSKNLPRWIAMYICQEIAGVTLQQIADRFELKRYGTVSTTIGKLKYELDQDPKLQTAVNKLRKKLAAQ